MSCLLLPTGQQWLALSEGVATEQVLPLLLEVCRMVGGPATAALSAAWDAYMRDKDTGQVALDQVSDTFKSEAFLMQ